MARKSKLPPGAFNSRLLLRNARRKPDWQLCDAIAAIVGAGPLVDLGAGTGRYVRALRRRGVDCIGVDACPDAERLSRGRVKVADLTGIIGWTKRYRWALCLEVGEHVPPELESTFLDNVAGAASEGLIVSWSMNLKGKGHVNPKQPEEVAAAFEARGFEVDELATKLIRVASLRESKEFCKKLLVMRRKKESEVAGFFPARDELANAGSEQGEQVANAAVAAPGPAREENPNPSASPVPDLIQVHFPGSSIVAAEPVAAVGDRLSCVIRGNDSNTSTLHRVVAIGECVTPADREKWLAAWRRLGGTAMRLSFEDGTPYEPG